MTDAPLENGPPGYRRTGLTRRSWLGAAATLPLAVGGAGRSLAASAQTLAVPGAASFPPDVKLTVAGPLGGVTDTWASDILAALAHALPPASVPRSIASGAADGVTGANQFEARAAPDGANLLIVPGATALAWLAGDTRAQFDVGHWVPVIAGTCPGVMALRGGRAALAQGGKIRIASSTSCGPELAALLGVELLGAQAVPVTGLMDDAAVIAALTKGSVDGVLLRGRRVADRLAAISTLGVLPVFGLGLLNDAGTVARDPHFPDLPEFSELLASVRPEASAGPLADGWRAIAATARLEFAVVLPQLTPAAMVAKWRRAGVEAAATATLATAANEQRIRIVGGASAAAEIAAMEADPGTLMELRRWLGTRLDWHPS
jgi:hypothetical protein